MSNRWTTDEIPELAEKVAIVTGANSGIGYETARALAERGAAVVMACRNLDKADAAAMKIRRDIPNATLEVLRLDLADLASVREFAKQFQKSHTRLELLINNAGVMVPPYTMTVDGFELQFGANHLGHFALTGLLLGAILATPGARVVTVSSSAHRMGKGAINFDDLNSENSYRAFGAYAQSKLANLLFTLELNRQLVAASADVMATAAHPGWTVTSLQRGFTHSVSWIFGQRPPMGALPTLRAAVDPTAQPNDYYGPSGMMELRGYPQHVESSASARDSEQAQRLWKVSEELTGIRYPWPVPAWPNPNERA